MRFIHSWMDLSDTNHKIYLKELNIDFVWSIFAYAD